MCWFLFYWTLEKERARPAHAGQLSRGSWPFWLQKTRLPMKNELAAPLSGMLRSQFILHREESYQCAWLATAVDGAFGREATPLLPTVLTALFLKPFSVSFPRSSLRV